MTTNVSIDFETFGVGTKPVLLSLGAVKHDGNEIVDEFHVGIDPGTCQAIGLEITASTVMWWMKDDLGAAREALLGLERVDIHSALIGFAQWFGVEHLPTWGNGASSDNVWMRSAYEAARIECPVPFFMDRCYRTMKNLFPDVVLLREGTVHDALDDARYQAKHLQAILDHIAAPMRAAPPAATVPGLLIDEGLRLIESHYRQFRIYEEHHERKSLDITLGELTRNESAGKANTNRTLAGEAEAFLAKIQAARA